MSSVMGNRTLSLELMRVSYYSFYPPPNPPSTLLLFLRCITMSVSLEGRYIKLEVIGAQNVRVPSLRIPAGIHISIIVDSTRCCKSAIGVLSSDESVAWSNTVTLSLDVSPDFLIEIRASFEFDWMLGNGEVVGQFETSWGALLDRGNEPFEISFPPVHGVRPSLMLKATSITECEIARETDAGHERFATYVTSGIVSQLSDALHHFQSTLDQCLVGHPDRTGSLTNPVWACLEGYTRSDLQDIESVTSLFREALGSRPLGHPDHPLSIYHLVKALIWRFSKENFTAVYIHESTQLCCKILPVCPEGTYLRSIAAGKTGVDYVIGQCNKLEAEGSDEGIHIRRVILELCPLCNKHRLKAFGRLGRALSLRFEHHGSADDLDECTQCCHSLGTALSTRFNHGGDVNDINRAISLHREALTLCSPGDPYRDYRLNNLAVALKIRYDKLDVSEDLNEAIDLFQDSLQLTQHGHPHCYQRLCSLSSALSSRFTQTQKNEDVEEAIRLCQDPLEALPSLHPDIFSSYIRLQEAYFSH
ncbi:hypothetical protein BDR04DRAFT_1235615 [Suillus decipiens]|nr:hypothetical protein BDR04DRAFT_1235615 [Suillus decipiens]